MNPWTQETANLGGVRSKRSQIALQITELGRFELPGVPHSTVGVGQQRSQRRVAAVVEIGRRPADEAQRRRVERPSGLDIVRLLVGASRPLVAARTAHLARQEQRLSAALGGGPWARLRAGAGEGLHVGHQGAELGVVEPGADEAAFHGVDDVLAQIAAGALPAVRRGIERPAREHRCLAKAARG